jgi:hypothetical protein
MLRAWLAATLAGGAVWVAVFWGMAYISYYAEGRNIHGRLFFIGMWCAPVFALATALFVLYRTMPRN